MLLISSPPILQWSSPPNPFDDKLNGFICQLHDNQYQSTIFFIDIPTTKPQFLLRQLHIVTRWLLWIVKLLPFAKMELGTWSNAYTAILSSNSHTEVDI